MTAVGITITCSDRSLVCDAVILVPQRAVDEPGYIRAQTAGGSGQDKHVLQALAQTAYYRYQDDELEISRTDDCFSVSLMNGDETVDSGMIIYRLKTGEIGTVVHGAIELRRLLESAYRYCTRWVRLDI